MSWLKAPLPALASALLFAGAFPPFSQWWLAWVWMLPLLCLLWTKGERRGWRQFFFGFRHGWLAGFFLFVATLWWVGHVTLAGMPALCAYLALYPAVWGGFAALLKPRSPGHGLLAALSLAMIWAGLEWVRSVMLTGFPWNGAAVPLVEMPGLRSLAAYVGVLGLSALPLFFMSGLAAAWTLRRHRSTRGRAALMAVCMAAPAVVTLATWRESPAPAGAVEVMLVQPNVSMEDKMDGDYDLVRYAEIVSLTKDAWQRAAKKPELVVWPESAIPGYFDFEWHADHLPGVLELGPLTLVAGCEARSGNDDPQAWNGHNCAAVLRGTLDNYLLHAKVHLVPFGEYIPLRRQLPFLETMLGDLIPMDFTPGTSLEPLRMEGLSFEIIPLVCFEDTIADVARRFVRDTPQIIVNITNDNWFRDSNESAMHALNARWRCLELQRPMVRSANTGVTCVIDTEGRMTSELPRWKQGVLHATVPLTRGGITFYAARGGVIPAGAGIAGLILAIGLLITKRHTA